MSFLTSRKFFVISLSLLLGVLLWDCYFIHETWIGRSRSLFPKEYFQNDGGQVSVKWEIDPAGNQPTVFCSLSDSYYWIMYTAQLIRDGDLRVRHTFVDNPPYGREVHWSQCMSWLMIVFIDAPLHFLFGMDWTPAIEYGALWINPIILTILMGWIMSVFWKELHGIGAFAVAFSYLSLAGTREIFRYGFPDHHGMQNVALIGTMLCFSKALWIFWENREQFTSETYKICQRWMTASAIFSAVGIWVQALLQQVMVAGILIGVAGILLFNYKLAEWWGGEDKREAFFKLWRRWGRVGAIACLGFYLLEYFPFNMEMRLESNHPFYFLAWWGGTEFIYQVSKYWGKSWPTRNQVLLTVVTLLLISFLPYGLWFGPSEWNNLNDPYLDRLHHYTIELQPLSKLLENNAIIAWLVYFGAFHVPVIAVLAALDARSFSTPGKKLLILPALSVTLLSVFISIFHVRFVAFHESTIMALALIMMVFFQSDWPGVWKKRFVNIVSAVILIPAIYSVGFFYYDQRGLFNERGMNNILYTGLSLRDVARNLFQEMPPGSRLLAGADLHSFSYFIGVPVTSSLYWENLPGLKSTSDFLADYDDEDAKRIASERGITHVLIWPARTVDIDAWHFIKYGNKDPEGVKKTMASRLFENREVPDWLEEVVGPPSQLLNVWGGRLYRVNPEKLEHDLGAISMDIPPAMPPLAPTPASKQIRPKSR